MTSEDQVVALFARANPVPSLDLLDPIDQVDIDRLKELSERSSEMTEVETIAPKKEGRRIRWVTVTVTSLAAMVALTVVFNDRLFRVEPATPVEVADAYMEAVNDRNFEAVVALFSPGTEAMLIEQQVGFEWWGWRAATGHQHLNQGCREVSQGEGGVLVECTFRGENDLTRVLRLPPGSGQVGILIADGRIQDLTDTVVDVGGVSEAQATFSAWAEENHPGDVDIMMNPSGDPYLDPESIALWEQYTDEFVAEMEAAG